MHLTKTPSIAALVGLARLSVERIGGIKTTLRVMQLTAIFLFVLALHVSARISSQTVSINVTNAPVSKVFNEIKKQTGYLFVYNKKLVNASVKVSITADRLEVGEVMEKILKDRQLEYSIRNKTIFISRKNHVGDLRSPIISPSFNSPPVTGIIRDADGNPIAGANIVVKGTKKGITTDGAGKFTLDANLNDVLIISSVGFNVKEIRIGSVNAPLIVALEKSISQLDEVQIIAYGTTSKRLSTGNIGTVKAKDIEKQPVNNPLLALQGRVPGLFIEQATGFAGTGVKVRIQGTNSMRSGNDPLYIIDGIPFASQLLPGGNQIVNGLGGLGDAGGGSPLNFINPADIESIDVLKDADATSIYGSRASNGAILITTKKGKASPLRANFNLQNGWADVSRKLDLMNGEQYVTMRREALKNDGITEPSPYDYDLNNVWDNSTSKDWQKELIGGTAQYRDLQTSISGGKNNVSFLVGAGYHKETNVFPGDFSDTKKSLHFNINSVSDNQRFKMQLSGSYLDDKNLLPNVDLTTAAMNLSPVAPVLLTNDGSINWQPDKDGYTTFFYNPMTYLYGQFKNKTNNLIGNGTISYQLFEGLEIKSNFGYNLLRSNTSSYTTSQSTYPEDLPYFPRITNFSESESSSWLIEPQLTYNRRFGKGKLEVLLGSTFQEENRNASSINASGFINDQVMEDIKSATSLSANYSVGSEYKYNALFGRLNFNWRDKYIVNLTARRDGSSRFGAKNQFHDFGAIGIAWVFSEEKIIRDNASIISFGKLRASYGTTGNDKIPDYQFLSLYNIIGGNQNPYQGVKGYRPTGLTNPYLQWEETKKLQIGLDLGFLNDRFLINTNYSYNRSSNQLLNFGLPIITGFSGITTNFPAIVQNTGWELSLTSRNIEDKGFTWSSNFNITIPQNKLLEFPDFSFTPTSLYAKGKSLNIQRKFKMQGVDPETGMYQFLDQNGNPTSSPIFGQDNIITIETDPKFYGGFQNSFSYKGFQLDILFTFTKQIAQNYALGGGLFAPGAFGLGTANQPAWLLDRWGKKGDISQAQMYTSQGALDGLLSTAYYYSDGNWGDASYIRLKNASFSWQLPRAWCNSARLERCKIFIQGQNLLTITNYVGLDPETKSSLSLPPLRVITFGLQISL